MSIEKPVPKVGRRMPVVLLVLGVAITAGVGGYAVGHRAEHVSAEGGEGSAEHEEQVDAVAAVQTAAIVRGTLAAHMTAFGSVVAQPGESRVVSGSFEARVVGVLVTAGQTVDVDTPVVRIEPSADTRLGVAESERAVAAAAADLERVQAQFDARLATHQELSVASQALDAVKLRAASLHDRGADVTAQVLIAGAAGVVAKVAVQSGQVVAAGAALVEVVPTAALEVRLGLEPGERISAGQVVRLTRRGAQMGTAAPVEGRVRLATRKISPDTRLVDVFVSLPPNADLALDEQLAGDWSGEPLTGLVAPREAVLPADEGHVLFTVRNGHAVLHKVSILAEERGGVLVSGEGLTEGDEAVVVGNFELEDGMAVDAGAAAKREASSTATAPTPSATDAETAGAAR